MTTWQYYHSMAMARADKAAGLRRQKKLIEARETYKEAADLELRALLLCDKVRAPATFNITRDSLNALREKANEGKKEKNQGRVDVLPKEKG